MSKKNAATRRRGNPAGSRTQAPEKPPALKGDEVLGDLIDSDFSVFVEPDGQVKIHARCEGDDPAASAAKVRFLVEALGEDFVPPPELSR